MAAWWRIRYPFMVDMALSASAPIFGFPGLCDEYGWNRVVTEAFRFAGGDECVEDIRSGYWQTGALSPEILSKEFNTCVPATLPCHSIQVAELVMNWLPTAAELGSYPVSNPNRSLTAWACDTVRGSPNGMAAYKRLLKGVLVQSTEPLGARGGGEISPWL